MFEVRAATMADLSELASLLDAYMNETCRCRWNGSIAVLARDGFGVRFDTVVATRNGHLVAFTVWTSAYDLHHCIAGADLLDLFVRPELRGHGIAVQLAATVAAKVSERGDRYIKGLAIDGKGVRRFYERVATAFEGADCIVGGRAFRVLASLSGQPIREVMRRLPKKGWNYES